MAEVWTQALWGGPWGQGFSGAQFLSESIYCWKTTPRECAVQPLQVGLASNTRGSARDQQPQCQTGALWSSLSLFHTGDPRVPSS